MPGSRPGATGQKLTGRARDAAVFIDNREAWSVDIPREGIDLVRQSRAGAPELP
jgi:hypothetical protein